MTKQKSKNGVRPEAKKVAMEAPKPDHKRDFSQLLEDAVLEVSQKKK